MPPSSFFGLWYRPSRSGSKRACAIVVSSATWRVNEHRERLSLPHVLVDTKIQEGTSMDATVSAVHVRVSVCAPGREGVSDINIGNFIFTLTSF